LKKVIAILGGILILIGLFLPALEVTAYLYSYGDSYSDSIGFFDLIPETSLLLFLAALALMASAGNLILEDEAEGFAVGTAVLAIINLSYLYYKANSVAHEIEAQYDYTVGLSVHPGAGTILLILGIIFVLAFAAYKG
jgi:hypothetical protein